MNLSFLPGQLQLSKQDDGTYLITIRGEEVFKSTNEKKAIAKFNNIRKDMEAQFPPQPLSPEEKSRLLREYISKDHSTFKGLPARKYKPGSSNTFG